MPVQDHPQHEQGPVGFTGAPSIVEIDERSARRTLRDQIAKLERELCSAFIGAYPRTGLTWSVAAPGGPRVLSLGELEEVRDGLAERLRQTRAELAERSRVEQEYRELIEHMLASPKAHKWLRVSHAEIGLPGCKSWSVRPRLGIIGMLAGWWHVKISSGCPLAT